MNSATYRNDIDSLRALAIIGVLIYHLWPNLLPYGYLGVDIFFVISGFLISRILFQSKKEYLAEILSFYSRRILRIFPALIIATLFTLFLGWGLLLADEYQELAKEAIQGTLFYANFIYLKSVNYFDPIASFKPLLHYWSLAVEEQFYLIWPLIALSLRNKKVLFWTSLLFLVFVVVRFKSNFLSQEFLFYMLPGRAWELLLGSLLASFKPLEKTHPLLDGLEKRHFSFLLLGFVVFSLCHSFIVDMPNLNTLVVVLGTAYLIWLGPNGSANKNILSNSVLRIIGLISYPLYLIHFPLNYLVSLLGLSSSANSQKFFVIFLSLIFAISIHFGIERPLKKMFATKKIIILISLLTFMVFNLLISRSIIKGEGYPYRPLNSHQAGVNFQFAEPRNENCLKMIDPKIKLPFCKMIDAANPTVALIGDSHANQIFTLLAEAYSSIKKQNLLLLGVYSCPPFSNSFYNNTKYISKNDCLTKYKWIENYLSLRKEITTVILNFQYPDTYLWEFSYPNISAAHLLNTYIENLTKMGKKVILIESTPELIEEPRVCFARRWQEIQLKKNCSVTLDLKKRSRMEEFFSLVTKNICRFNPRPFFQNQNALDLINEEKLIYIDKHHLSDQGAKVLVDAFVDSDCFH